MTKNKVVLQFRVSLLGVSPEVWRRIIVPETYSFWDFHVAIQDAMGWLDYHLHEFRLSDIPDDDTVKIGIPSEEFDGYDDPDPGWEICIAELFAWPGDTASYIYDFGDNWRHEILLEAIAFGEKRVKYPKCVAGEGACPPEDCGGIGGYARLLKILDDAADEEHKDMVSWLQGHAKNYYPFSPAEFSPEAVIFSNPKKRFEEVFTYKDLDSE